MSNDRHSPPERLLTCAEAAKILGTFDTSGERFPRRLIAERRIEFVKVGRHVRISEPALAAFIDAGRVHAMTPPDIGSQIRPVA
jgi:excisionase family DNA binding protein